MGSPRLVDDVIPLVRKVFRERRILGSGPGIGPGPEITESELDHIIRHSHCENFTYKKREMTDYKFNLKMIFGNLAIYLSTLHPLTPGGKKLYVPLYIQRFITLKEMIFKTTPQNFFIHMKAIREILLEIYVNNVSSMVLQKYLFQTFVEWIDDHWKADPSKKSEIITHFIGVTSKINYMMVTANKDVLFHELYILEIIKIVLDSSS
jgi:hypothetical protein